jgi:hypothetical protein
VGPDRKDKLGSSNPKVWAEQNRAEVIAKSTRLILEAQQLRAKADDLMKRSAELLEKFKRDHPNEL